MGEVDKHMRDEIIFFQNDIRNLQKAPLKFDYCDFKKIEVNSKNIQESNEVLSSIWRELGIKIGLREDRCPWIYTPKRITNGSKSYVFFGSVNSRIGEILFACSFIKKGTIDEFAYLIKNKEDRSVEKEALIYQIIKAGLDRKGEKEEFTVSYEIMSVDQGGGYYKFAYYQGKNFVIESNDDGNCRIKFRCEAHDRYSLYNKAQIIIAKICDFLTVLTNTLVEYCEMKAYLGWSMGNERSMDFADKEYIDFILVDNQRKILLIKEAILVIDLIIDGRKIEDMFDMQKIVNCSQMFREAMEIHFICSGQLIGATDTQVLTVHKINGTSRTNMLGTAASLYMSALEAVTLSEKKPEKCSECGQAKFEISSRIEKIGTQYLGAEVGKILKKIYAKRSGYFHASNMFNCNLGLKTLPQLDERTETRCMENGFSSIMYEGQSVLVFEQNIMEWVSYIIRQECISVCDKTILTNGI